MRQVAMQYGADPKYPGGFFSWLARNQRIYNEFEKQALRMALRGRKRYSARTIIEVIRWNTDLRDSGSSFKINGNQVPGMARLFMETHGEKYPKFFELRDSLGR